MKNLVSVIIPTYGRPLRLEKAIQSVIEQTYENIEIIVVDDNSPGSLARKETENLTKKYADKIKYVKMKKNSGGSLARNEGILNSEGEYITFLDDDDVYYPKKIEKQINVIENNPEIDFVGCDMDVYIEEYDKNVQKGIFKVKDLKSFILDGNCYTPMIFIKKSLLLKVGMFTDSPKYQDHILVLKLLEKKVKIARIEEALFRHTVHLGERIMYSPNFMKAIKIRNFIEDNHLEIFKNREKRLLFFSRKIRILDSLQNLEERRMKEEFKILLELLINFNSYLNFRIFLNKIIKFFISKNLKHKLKTIFEI